jgi:hypothetical protein
MGRITLGRLETAAFTTASDDDELRLRSSDRELTTATRGLFGRAVRSLLGATKQHADNKKIMANVLHGLKQRYRRQSVHRDGSRRPGPRRSGLCANR